MKNLLKEIRKTIDSEHEGYEMGCLISPEFTPAPTFSSVEELIGDKELEIFEYLQAKAKKEFITMKDEVLCEEQGSTTIGEMDFTYTPSGAFYEEIRMILLEAKFMKEQGPNPYPRQYR